MARTAAAPHRPDNETEPLFNGLVGTLAVVGVLFAGWAYTTPYAQGETLEDASALARNVPVTPHWDPIVMPKEAPVPVVAAPTTPGRAGPSHAPAPAKTADSSDGKPRSLLLREIGHFGESATHTLFIEESDVDFTAAIDGVRTAEHASLADPTFKHGHVDRIDARIGGVGLLDGGNGSTGDGAPVKVAARNLVAAAPDMPDGDDRSAIVHIMQKNAGRVTSCLDQALKADPNVSGRLGVGFTIVAGRVTEVHLVENSTHNEQLGTCVAHAVRAIRFDPGLDAEVENFPWIVSGR